MIVAQPVIISEGIGMFGFFNLQNISKPIENTANVRIEEIFLYALESLVPVISYRRLSINAKKVQIEQAI